MADTRTPSFLRTLRAADGLTRIALERPPVNVLGVQELEELARCVRESPGSRVLVLSGLPAAFCAGVEIADHVPESGAIDRMLEAMRAVLTELLQVPAVTVASVAGACLGGGAEIAAACDLVLVAEDARIGFPEIRLSCFPPGGVALLPLRIGPARAAEWILTGRAYSGNEAATAGFATGSHPRSALERETERAARELLSRGPAALAGARDLLREPRREALRQLLPRAEAAYRRLASDDDLARAVREFALRRKP